MFARKSLLIMISNLVNGMLAFVALYYISRDMGPEAYGIIGFAMGFVGLFTILTDLGFNSAHIKRVSEGKEMGTCIGTYLISKLFFMLLLIVAVIGAIAVWKFFLGRGFESSTQELAVYIIIAYYAVNSIGTFFSNTYTATKEIAKAQIPLVAGAVGRTIAIIVVAFSGLGALALAWAYVLGEVIFLIASSLFFRGFPVKKPTRECFKDYTIFAMPLILVGISYTIVTNVDRVLIQLFWSSIEVGYYFACYRIVQFLLVAASAVGTLLLPTISGYHSREDIESIKRTVFLSERYISMTVFPIVIGIVVLAEPTVRILLSSSFYQAIPILMVLPFFVILEALSQPYMYEVIGMNKPVLARNRILIILGITVFFDLILIPKNIHSLGLTLFGWGAVGASVATVIGYTAGLVYCRYASWKLAKNPFNPRILLHLLAAGIMGIIVYELMSFFPIQRWYILLGFAVFGLGIYLFILFILREFTRKDLDFVLDLLNIKKMWKYVHSEIKDNGGSRRKKNKE
jgi:O-antigen/teichoic acid export membrane protein